jgi:hypothetical protein
MTRKKRKSKDQQPAESFEHQVQDAFKKLQIDTEGDQSVEKKPDVTEESPTEAETLEEKADVAETAAAESEAEATVPESNQQSQPQEAKISDEVSMDDLLDDVRRSLIEDETQSEEKRPGWLSRIARGFQKQPAAESEFPREEEVIPRVPDVPVEAPQEDPYLDEIDELIEMLEPKAAEEKAEPEPVDVAEVAPTSELEVPPVDMEELKKPVFSRPEDRIEEEMGDEVRAAALEDGEEVFVEVQAGRTESGQQRLRTFEDSLRPYRQYIYVGMAAVGVLVAVFAIGFMYTFYQRNPPQRPTPNVSNLPNPVAMNLPGGLHFNLARGTLEEGKWNPTGPEWLIGTEICRWVAIPWSKQLEAVVRTLTREDSIELVMSNDDRLLYNVFSIQELTLEEMQSLDQNSPCLLLVLAEQDAEKRWVVIAKP